MGRFFIKMKRTKKVLFITTIIAICVLTPVIGSVSAESGVVYYSLTPFTIVANTHNFGAILLESKFKDGSIESRISVERTKTANNEYVFNVIRYSTSGSILNTVTIPSIDNVLNWKYIMINFTYAENGPITEIRISYQYISVKGTELKYYQGGEEYSLGTALGEYKKPIDTNATVPGSYFVTLYANAQALFENSLPGINSDIESALQNRLNQAYSEGENYGYSQGYASGLYDGAQEAGGFWEGTISLIKIIAEKLWDFLSFEIAPGIKMGYITLGVPLLIGTITLILRKIFGGKDDD